MRYIPPSLALFGAIALAMSTPAQAVGDESSAAVAEATEAVQNARQDMLETFGTDHLEIGHFLWQGGKGEVTRVVVSLANAAVNRARKKNPKSKCNTGPFQSRFKSARGGRERLRSLIFAKLPNVLDL